MIFKVSHLFNIIFVLPLIYLLARGFQHIYLDLKKKSPKVDFDDLVKQKEQLLLLTLGKTPLDNSCKTFATYQEKQGPGQEKILDIFKCLQWGEGPFQREVLDFLKKSFGVSCDFLIATSSIKFLIKNELLLNFKTLPDYQKILELTSLVGLYKVLLVQNSEQSVLKRALIFQISGGEKQNLSPKEIDEALIKLIKNDQDILEELFLYTKVIDRLKEVPPLKSNSDLKGALKIMGLPENSSKDDIKKRYRNLALAQHPDTFAELNIQGDLLKQAGENFNRINIAYKLLMAKAS